MRMERAETPESYADYERAAHVEDVPGELSEANEPPMLTTEHEAR